MVAVQFQKWILASAGHSSLLYKHLSQFLLEPVLSVAVVQLRHMASVMSKKKKKRSVITVVAGD